MDVHESAVGVDYFLHGGFGTLSLRVLVDVQASITPYQSILNL